MSLREYVRKRNFAQTREPTAKRGVGRGSRFVIQKHAASRLHYDFRLEVNGTLKSWAVPKGIPFVKGEKRLAVEVEDHPVSYIDFEGTIPKGQYGGGTVMVWDEGTFETPSPAPAKELAGGKLHFELHGKKLHGEWYLVRLRDEKQWLLIRGGANMRPVSQKMDDTSALSGRTMKQLSASDHIWQSKPRATLNPAKAGDSPKKRGAKSPLKFVEPMKARLLDSPPTGDWIYEIKFDGFRALALKEGEQVRLFSRNEKDFGGKFPDVAAEVAELDAGSAIIDGEIVALDPKGRSSFQLLQAYEIGEQHPPLFFYVFDLLHLDGKDLQRVPLLKRKELLKRLVPKKNSLIRFSDSLGQDAGPLLKQMRQLGLEGLIGKRPDSCYEPGQRSGAWIKLKLHAEQEFVIGGYTDPEGSRQHFGALLAGYHQKGKLLFSGKVGTGFNQPLLRELHDRFEKIAQAKCPFANLPEAKGSRYSPGLTAAGMKHCHWLKPRLVCQLKFSEWTRDGKLRQPVFLGLREDKDAREVVREKALHG